jgi:hypothetical protein
LLWLFRDTIEYEPSYVVCENLVPTGRMSFKKFNPAIEVSLTEIPTPKSFWRMPSA